MNYQILINDELWKMISNCTWFAFSTFDFLLLRLCLKLIALYIKDEFKMYVLRGLTVAPYIIKVVQKNTIIYYNNTNIENLGV